MRILVTGAAGFIGAALLDQLTQWRGRAEIDAVDISRGRQDNVRWIEGGLDAAGVQIELSRPSYDVVFHLATVPGGLSECDPALGRRVNLDASLDLLEILARSGSRPRFVYASSIAVYGDMRRGPVGAASETHPAITYGAHKRMVELALADFSRRGEISGLALRLPGIIARPGPAAGFGSAFMSELPRALAAAKPYVCPVSETATAWWMSARRAAKNFIHAAEIAEMGVLQLPALHLSVANVVDALCGIYGEGRRALVNYSPDPDIEAVYGQFPALATEPEEKLGFRHDGSAINLIQEALTS